MQGATTELREVLRPFRWPPLNPQQTACTDASGHAALPSVPPGDYELTLKAPEDGSFVVFPPSDAIRRITLAAGDSLDVSWTLHAAERLTVLLLDLDQRPLESLIVRFEILDRKGVASFVTASSAEDGVAYLDLPAMALWRVEYALEKAAPTARLGPVLSGFQSIESRVLPVRLCPSN